jgi:hypothetical protein
LPFVLLKLLKIIIHEINGTLKTYEIFVNFCKIGTARAEIFEVQKFHTNLSSERSPRSILKISAKKKKNVNAQKFLAEPDFEKIERYCAIQYNADFVQFYRFFWFKIYNELEFSK